MPSRSNESTPLLGTANGNGHTPSPEPSSAESWRYFILGSYFNILLFFIPLSAAAHHLNWDAAFRFSFSFLAIVPLAKLLGVATEQIATRLGDIQAGLLNASFGNAVEIIVGVVALLHGELRIVQTSMLGSILSNILLVLGCSFLAAGMKRYTSYFKPVAAQASSSLMTLSCITLVIPAAYYNTQKPPSDDPRVAAGLNFISRGTAVILLIVYAFYIYFQLNPDPEDTDSPARPSGGEPQGESEHEKSHMTTISAAIALLGTTVVTAICADYLVASIEEFAELYGIPMNFIGLILLPIVANAAEHVTAVWMAAADRMELALTICVGSSIQIAAFVVPLLVIVGWIVDRPLTLFFHNFETAVLFVSVLLVNTLLQDGKSNFIEGLMLLSLYFVIAIAVWVS